ncbi:TPA: thiamine biosynthesis protein ThiS [Candidatus Delongbacteria bacterium]|nr:MAG: thiamine biosynthesis protein ThiS [Candidatus Delongbacteria bacterium GWF2_40_14]HAQ61608.1 thiamine biosynthesis protein ThiS [Candidatus Delongbacteria bacterium]
MEVTVNGKIREIKSCDLLSLISETSLNPSTVVIELNGKIIKKADWAQTKLNLNDKIEILNFVGGG